MSGTTQQAQDTISLVKTHYQQANQFYQAGNYEQAYHELQKARQYAQDQTQIEHIEKNIRELESMMQEPESAVPAAEEEQQQPKREPNKMAILTILVGLICLTPIVMKCIEIFSQPSVQSAAVNAEEEATENTTADETVVTQTDADSPATPQATPNVIVEEDINGNLIPAGAPAATVNGSSINLRESPSVQAAAMGTLSNGQRVTILANATISADGHTWSQVQTASGASGWIASQFLQNEQANTPVSVSETENTAAASLPETATTETRQVSGTGVSLRGTPSTSGVLITTLSQTQVTVIQEQAVNADGHSWTKVRTRNGSEGWIANQFLN